MRNDYVEHFSGEVDTEGLKITKVFVHLIQGSVPTTAVGYVDLNGAIRLGGLKIFNTEEGVWIQYPKSSKTDRNIWFPMDGEMRGRIDSALKEAFRNAITKNASTGALSQSVGYQQLDFVE
jgi:DNA-binding cell septation regulator SpoVG